MVNLDQLSEKDKGLAIKIATLRVIQTQRKLSNRAMEQSMGLRNGSMIKFYAGDEAYLYLIDRVERTIESLSKKKERKRVSTETVARRELQRRAGEWIDADEWVKLVESSRGGDHLRIYYQNMMEELPFHGSVDEEDA